MTDESSCELLPVGSLVDDRYEIGEVLGEGGMATVYAAMQIFIERPVALKVLSVPPGRDHGLAERFLDEARLASRIDHPNVATIHDFGFASTTLGRRPYIVMSRLEGHDLAEEIDRHGAIEPTRALELMLKVLDALAVAHRQGIVHKDLTPGNLFLTHPHTPDEDIQIVDFGVAGALDDAVRRTHAGHLAGTPSYMAPEYIELGTISPTVDVYQITLVFLEMLTGRPVVTGRNAHDIMTRQCRGRLNIPPVLREGPLAELIERGVHLDPDRRFPNAAALKVALEAHRDVFADLATGVAAPAAQRAEPTVVTRDSTRPGGEVPSSDEEIEALFDQFLDEEERPPHRGDDAQQDDRADEPVAPGPSPRTATTLQTRRRRTWLLAALVVLLGGVAAVVMGSRGERAASPSSPETATQSSAPGAAPEPIARADIARLEVAAPAPTVVDEPRAVVVHVESTPPGARLIHADTVLGVTPASLEVMPGPDEVVLRVELDGHRPGELRFVPSPGDEVRQLTIALAPAGQARRRPLAEQGTASREPLADPRPRPDREFVVIP